MYLLVNNKLYLTENLFDCYDRVVNHHSRTGITHHTPYGFTHIWSVAVYRADFAFLFVFAETAMVKTFMSILKQGGALIT